MAVSLLNDQIQKTGCYALNEKDADSFGRLFVGDHTLALESDADEQLIINIAFNQTVSLSSVEIGLPSDGKCPQKVKFFCNKNNLGFSDAPDTAATQEFTLEPPETKPSSMSLKLHQVKWNRVDSITLFIEDNHGADTSSIYSLKFFGTTVHSTNMADFGKSC
jgi:hypothetical protein